MYNLINCGWKTEHVTSPEERRLRMGDVADAAAYVLINHQVYHSAADHGIHAGGAGATLRRSANPEPLKHC